MKRPLAAALRESSALTKGLDRGLELETFEPRLLLSADLIPVAGSIAFPGQTNLYTFDLAEERSFLFDSLTADSQLRWSLSGPGGAIVAPTSFTQSDGAQGGGIISLGAGTYTMRVEGSGDHRGDYEFRLLNVANGAPIDTGTRIEGTLGAQGRETDVFRFEATAGTELFFDAQTHGGGTAYWQLIDPDGNSLFGPRQFLSWSDPERLTIQKTGTYTLLLEGQIWNQSDVDYAFTVERVVDEHRTIALDSVVTGAIAQAGQRHELSFSLGEDQRLFLDVLLPSDLRWTLVGPRGVEMAQRSVGSSDWRDRDPVLDLIAGDYTFVIGDGTDRLGSYAFQLLSAASAEQISLGETVSGTLSDRDVSFVSSVAPSTAPTAGGPGDNMLVLTNNGPTVTVQDDPALRPETFTVETWLRADHFRQWDSILIKSTHGSWQDGYGLYLDGSGNLHFYVDSYTNSASSVFAPIAQGVFTHVAATYD